MYPIKKLFTSSVGKKYLMSLTGLALVGFLVAHLLGNLQLLLPGNYFFNKYAYHLETLKPLVWAAELGLIALAGIHALVALAINLGALQARPDRYVAAEVTKGGDSKSNLSSRHMLLLGIVILTFIVVHIWQFKYGPGMSAGYVMDLHGEKVRDLYRLVVEVFKKPIWVLFYVGALSFLGFHLRHGVWSALQSLGAMPGKVSKVAYAACVAFAIALTIGFILLPVWIYLDIFGVYK